MDMWANVPPIATSVPNPPSAPTTTIIPNPIEFEHITDFGRNTLWVVFIIMVISSIAFTVVSWRITVQKRLFYQLTTYITVIAAISYYAMASGSGWSFHGRIEKQEHDHDLPTTRHRVLRQVFYARYLDWLFTTPLLLLDLAILAGVNGSNIINIILADIVMILTGLFAAFSHTSRQQWGWYTIGWLGFIVIIWQLATDARVTAQRRGVQTLFIPLSAYTIIIWLLYPIVWGISDGAHNLTPDREVLAYAILDVLAKPVFGTWLLVAHKRLAASHVHIDGVWSDGFGRQEGTLRVGDDEEA